MSSIPVNNTSSRPTVSWNRIIRAGVIGMVVAIVANIVLFFIASALGAMPQDVITPMGQPLNLQAVLTMTIMPAVVATIVYGVLTRVTRNPVRWFTIIAAIVLVGMFFGPFSLPGVGAGQIVALELMHFVVAGALVWALTTQARPE